MAATAAHLEPLTKLGFTALEAEVYGFLLQEPAVTGYRVAQALGKPASNVYKALESLEAKGAVLVDDARRRVVRPVPPEELLAGIERRFVEERERAARALRRIGGTRGDDRVYQLRTPDQVLDRCRAMLGRAAGVVLVDAFPVPLATLGADLERVAARGVLVAVKSYAPATIAGARLTQDRDGAKILERWPGDWLNLVIDGREHLIALLGSGGESVHQAVWSGSRYLSWVYHSAVSKEIILAAVLERLAGETTVDALRQLVDELLPIDALDASGYRELVAELRGGAATGGGSAGDAAAGESPSLSSSESQSESQSQSQSPRRPPRRTRSRSSRPSTPRGRRRPRS